MCAWPLKVHNLHLGDLAFLKDNGLQMATRTRQIHPRAETQTI